MILIAITAYKHITFGGEGVHFHARTAQSGNWSEAETWEGRHSPQAGDFVQVRSGHMINYDVHSDVALRMLHIAGVLTFSREKSTLLDIGLIKIEPGETTTEDGFECQEEHIAADILPAGTEQPALEIGTCESPIPTGVTTTIRLRHFPGTNAETLPAIISCGGRWDVHGLPMKRTWLKLALPAKIGDTSLTLEQSIGDWNVGDQVIITTGDFQGPETGTSFQKKPFGRQKPVGTEERSIKAIEGAVLTLDRPLQRDHRCETMMRCEVANLSRNVVIESAEPAAVRGHTMYHNGSAGSISYAEFRHLGKEGVLGKYAIHFHLVRDSMRGCGVNGASIWDSHNRWITVHGTDHLLIRDCVGYQSRGHGYFLEDATEQWNVFDRNLAVQAFSSVPLPKQVLPFDSNDGAGFWWANGRNTFIRNAACENDRYGYHFQIANTPDFDTVLHLSEFDDAGVMRDVRTIPFLRFEDNESHSEGLFSFRFGDEMHGTVHGDREHPFIARNLRAWETRYAIRPNIQFFLLDGLRIENAAFGIYHPDYDAHVYRDLVFRNISAEPLNGGHDEQSVPYGDFTYDRLSLENCRLGRDPLIQLTAVGPKPGIAGHFRGVTLQNCQSREGGVVDFGGGPTTKRIDNPINYYFHGSPTRGILTHVMSVKIPGVDKDATYRGIDEWTGPEARAATINGLRFPELISPIDDLPPATFITSIEHDGPRRIVRGVAHDNGEIRSVSVNGQFAQITAQYAGVADWMITLDSPADGRYRAESRDVEGNAELRPHRVSQRP